jgi:hypothetical protein
VKIKHFIIFLVALSILLMLPACTRSASTVEPKSVEGTSEVDFPVLTEIGPTQAPIEVFGTQTAQAMVEAQTVEPPAVVESPTPEIVAQPTEEPAGSGNPESSSVESNPTAFVTSSNPSFPVFEGYGPGFPTFGIRGVVQDQSVTIQANDFPADQTYVVMMGPMYTGAINGIVVDTKSTGEGGAYLESYQVPDSLVGSDRIAIRIEFSGGRYAVNWFWNNTTY